MSQTPARLAAAPSAATAAAGARLCVLCVDDEPQVLEGLRLQLHRFYEVLVSCTGAEALHMLRGDKRIGVIISDMRMPVMDGASFLRQARQLAPDVPRILLTGQADTASAVTAVNQGQIFGFLVKPCPPVALIAAVTAAAGRYRLTAAQKLLLEQNRRREPGAERAAEALRQLFAQAVELFGCRYAALGLHDEAGWPPRQVIAHGLDPAVFAPSPVPPLLERLLHSREALQLSAADDPEALKGLPGGHPEVTQFLGVPVLAATRSHGWMYFAQGPRGVNFGPDEVQAATIVAAACANICEAARARGEARQQAEALSAEKALRDQAEMRAFHLVRGQNLLRSVIAARSTMAERDELLYEACRAAVAIGGLRQAWIGLFDDLLLHPAALRGAEAPFAERLCALFNTVGGACRESLAAALYENRPLVCNDAAADPALADAHELAREHGFGAWLALPLSMQGRNGGALFLHAAEPGWFNAAEVSLMTALAAEISQALELHARERELDYLAYHDPLTQLPNRRLFLERLDAQLHAMPARRRCVLVADIERFKYLNDSLGQESGDEVLRQVAARLLGATGDGLAARIGGDRFALALDAAADPVEQAAALRRSLLEVLAAPMAVGADTVHAAARLGFALFPEDGGDADRLLRQAEAAMKSAKAAGDRVRGYTPQLGAAIASRTRLEAALRRAVAARELQVHYQPLVDVGGGAISGAECLLRWFSPELGPVSPAEFVPVLEETCLIVEVGEWVLQQVMADLDAWRAAGLAVPPVAVNVSAVQFRQPDFVEQLRRTLAAAPACAGSIALELTESTLMTDADEGIRKLRAIRELGIGIAMDDFGTGYSSLSYLSRLPVSVLKIDRSFIAALGEGRDAMVSGIVALAHALGLKVVAEGVERPEQLECLRRLACEQFQGFLFSAAVPPAQFAALLRQGRRPAGAGA